MTNKEDSFATRIFQRMRDEGIRVEIDDRNEMLGHKVREAQLDKIPYMLIIGAKEVKDGLVTIRKRNGENLKEIRLDEFIPAIKSEIRSK